MLVLSRVGEEIVINDNIRVTVVAVKGDRVRIGVVAPRDVCVDRSEIHERRMQFEAVPVGIGSDADAAIGVMLPRCADDTKTH